MRSPAPPPPHAPGFLQVSQHTRGRRHSSGEQYLPGKETRYCTCFAPARNKTPGLLYTSPDTYLNKPQGTGNETQQNSTTKKKESRQMEDLLASRVTPEWLHNGTEDNTCTKSTPALCTGLPVAASCTQLRKGSKKGNSRPSLLDAQGSKQGTTRQTFLPCTAGSQLPFTLVPERAGTTLCTTFPRLPRAKKYVCCSFLRCVYSTPT